MASDTLNRSNDQVNDRILGGSRETFWIGFGRCAFDCRVGYAERGMAVQNCDADLEFPSLAFEVPLHRRQSARPGYLAARRASFRAMAPAVTVFHGIAFLRGGMTASAPRSARWFPICRDRSATISVVSTTRRLGARRFNRWAGLSAERSGSW